MAAFQPLANSCRSIKFPVDGNAMLDDGELLLSMGSPPMLADIGVWILLFIVVCLRVGKQSDVSYDGKCLNGKTREICFLFLGRRWIRQILTQLITPPSFQRTARLFLIV
jgi:hypothetical protein